jgi:hypothetical protein
MAVGVAREDRRDAAPGGRPDELRRRDGIKGFGDAVDREGVMAEDGPRAQLDVGRLRRRRLRVGQPGLITWIGSSSLKPVATRTSARAV